MSPKEDFEVKRQMKEDAQLENMVTALSDKDKVNIYEKGNYMFTSRDVCSDKINRCCDTSVIYNG
jgi:hypothetical protein